MTANKMDLSTQKTYATRSFPSNETKISHERFDEKLLSWCENKMYLRLSGLLTTWKQIIYLSKSCLFVCKCGVLFNFYEMQMRAERGAALVNMNNEFNSLVALFRAANSLFFRAHNACFTNRHVFICWANFFYPRTKMNRRLKKT